VTRQHAGSGEELPGAGALEGVGQQGPQASLEAAGRHDDRNAPKWSTAAASTSQTRRFTISAFILLVYPVCGPNANARASRQWVSLLRRSMSAESAEESTPGVIDRRYIKSNGPSSGISAAERPWRAGLGAGLRSAAAPFCCAGSILGNPFLLCLDFGPRLMRYASRGRPQTPLAHSAAAEVKGSRTSSRPSREPSPPATD